ncbi:MAG TPA: hypothetical protein VEB42_12420 [Chitinophagaceae bacterium]|nr:hypothetical protein [Chitinophagaceae bacterium]
MLPIIFFLALAIIVFFIVFAVNKRAKGEKLGEHEPSRKYD